MATIHPSRLGLVPQDSRLPPESARLPRRRASPEYNEYRGPPAGTPWRGVGNDMMESRRAKREATVVNIWPPSPKEPARDLSPARKKKKKSKRDRSTDSSEEEHRRRRHRKKDRKRRRSPSTESSDEEPRRRRREPERERQQTPEEEWVVKPSVEPAAPAQAAVPMDADADNSDDSLGPQPLPKQTTTKRVDEREYGGALLRGEGSAMAAFLQDGTESRIPRRGEIGMTSDEIAQFENVGYVMSGNRHRRMNAVRIRKENQVISAEEKRGILKLQKEERERREAILREEFSELVSERLKGTEQSNNR
ncbi:DEAD-box protein abstrakt [Mycena kentingensis (nom. inval.)]|nr:DEAD-box protein abstrakt [Mycena kentingensis (nom. inval.)]